MSAYIVDFDQRKTIRTIYENWQAGTSGPYTVTWDGRNDSGSTVFNGQYYFKIVEMDTQNTVLRIENRRISCNGRSGSISNQGGVLFNPFGWGNYRSVTAYYDVGNTKDYRGGATTTYAGHKGTDYGAPRFTYLYAAFSGTVVEVVEDVLNNQVGNRGSWGNRVCVYYQTDPNVLFRYAHLAHNSVQPEELEFVSVGAYIALVDNTGGSTGDHLHLELYVGGTAAIYRVCPYQGARFIEDPRPNPYPIPTYLLTITSLNPTSGVAITITMNANYTMTAVYSTP